MIESSHHHPPRPQKSDLILLKNCRIWTWKQDTTHQHPTGYIQYISSLIINKTTGFIDKIVLTSQNNNTIDQVNSSTTTAMLVDDANPLNEEGKYSQLENIIDLKGQLVLPGLSDAHIHVAMVGESQYFLDLSSCFSIEELQMKIKEHVERHPDLDWIQGVNWDQTKLGK